MPVVTTPTKIELGHTGTLTLQFFKQFEIENQIVSETSYLLKLFKICFLL